MKKVYINVLFILCFYTGALRTHFLSIKNIVTCIPSALLVHQIVKSKNKLKKLKTLYKKQVKKRSEKKKLRASSQNVRKAHILRRKISAQKKKILLFSAGLLTIISSRILYEKMKKKQPQGTQSSPSSPVSSPESPTTISQEETIPQERTQPQITYHVVPLEEGLRQLIEEGKARRRQREEERQELIRREILKGKIMTRRHKELMERYALTREDREGQKIRKIRKIHSHLAAKLAEHNRAILEEMKDNITCKHFLKTDVYGTGVWGQNKRPATIRRLMEEIQRYIPYSRRDLYLDMQTHYTGHKNEESRASKFCHENIFFEEDPILRDYIAHDIPLTIHKTSLSNGSHSVHSRLATISKEYIISDNPPALALTEYVESELLRMALRIYLPLIRQYHTLLPRSSFKKISKPCWFEKLESFFDQEIANHNDKIRSMTNLSEKERDLFLVDREKEEADVQHQYLIKKEYLLRKERESDPPQTPEEVLASGKTSSGKDFPPHIIENIIGYIVPYTGTPRGEETSLSK